MEPADIDWKMVVSRYVRDEAYEGIGAPRWADLSSPDPDVDDEAWFCRADCRHPKTAEDFLKLTPSPKSKLLRSASAVLPFGERNTNNTTIRDGNNLKRRGGGIGAFMSAASSPKPKVAAAAKKKFQDDSENQDPEMATPPPPLPASRPPFGAHRWAKNAKAAVKSSAEKRPDDEKETLLKKNVPPPRQLKSTLSARNLFSGKDILGQISELYNELKRMAGGRGASVAVEEVKEQETMEQKSPSPLKESSNGVEKKSRKMVVRVETGKERSPSVLKEVKATPPTPQRFPSPSTNRVKNVKAGTTTAASSPLRKPPKSTPEKGGILNRDVENNREAKRQPFATKDMNNTRACDAEGNSASMLWFLKPCTFLVE